jgi:hypothetical protein
MSIPASLQAMLTDSGEDDCHGFECYSYPSLLVRHIVPAVLNGIP